MQQPSTEIIYDALAQLMQERKIYQTSKGYFIVTPEYVQSLHVITLNPFFTPSDLNHLIIFQTS